MRRTKSESLGLIHVGEPTDAPLEALKDPIVVRYPWFEVETLPSFANIGEAFDSLRRQYHSTRILALLEEHIQSTSVDRLLGVTNFDIYIPGTNFVFGEARLPGRVGIVSTDRLRTPTQKTFNLCAERIVKEAIHELGHMLGLKHCTKGSCVMHLSESLKDTDVKGSNLCERCQHTLGELRHE